MSPRSKSRPAAGALPLPALRVVPPPALVRDPWAWLCALAIVPALIGAWGAPLGEPVADDFDFLYRALFERGGTLLDGFGGPYWRPMARQLYFGPLADIMLRNPGAIAALHVLLLAVTGVLLYRALRPRWSGPAAAAAASFPLLMESSRMLIAWPSHFQEIGALFFAALAAHEASRARLPTALAALLAAVLSKEVGVVAAIALPFLAPVRAGEHPGRVRITWMLSALVTVGTWAGVYASLVFRHAVVIPHADATVAPVPWFGRFEWAVWSSLRAIFSLPSEPGRWDGVVMAGVAAVALLATGRVIAVGPARARFRAATPWIVGGVAWFLAASATLAPVHPAWWPNRAIVGAVGLGVAVAAAVAAADPRLLVCLLAVRLFSFAVSAPTPHGVSVEPLATGDAFDFNRLVRLQRLVRDSRLVLAERFATLPSGAAVSQHNLPLLSEYAFAGSKGLRLWFRDSTLRWVRFEDYRAGKAGRVAGLVEWQPRGARQVALVETEAMESLLRGTDDLRGARWRESVAELTRADSLQRDRSAGVFLGTVASKRALCLVELGELDAATRAARDGLADWPENPDSHYALAAVSLRRGDRAAAVAQLDSLLATHPNDAGARGLRAQIVRASAGGTP